MNNIAASNELPHRYPGLKPFERSQSAVFHGRKEDIQRLTNLVMRERLVVLSAKSGIGKTSLLQAGVAPELEKQDFVPIFFRTEKTDAPLLDSIRAVLEKSPAVARRDNTDERPGEPPSLWELMKRLEFDLNGMPATPVLIFDQFEELFTLSHSVSSRQRFIQDLGELANETMPDSLRTNLLRRYQTGEISLETMKWWEAQPDLRIVLSLRSDFLYLIEELSERMPDIKRNGYQLLPLNREQARIAIIQPALAEGEYACHPFEYSDKALAEIIDFLSGQNADEHHVYENAQGHRKREEVESVNLQIVCRDIEEKIIASKQPECFVVEPPFYNGVEGLRYSLSNFYHNQLEAFPTAYKERIATKIEQGAILDPDDFRLKDMSIADLAEIAQRLIEENLVTAGDRRNSVVDDTLLDTYHISPDFLNTLVDKSRLLRKEPRLDDFYYEISHDTLLPAIIESRNKRRTDERIKAEQEILRKEREKEAEHVKAMQAELKQLKERRKLARWAAISSLISMLLMVALVGYFLDNYITDVNQEFTQAETNIRNEQFDAATATFNNFKGKWRRRLVINYLHRPAKSVYEEANVTEMFHLKYDSIVNYLRIGDSLFFSRGTQALYSPALSAYHAARNVATRYDSLNHRYPHVGTVPGTEASFRIAPARVDEWSRSLDLRIQNCLETIITRYTINQRAMESFEEALSWGQVRRNLLEMKDLLPKEPVYLDSLRIRLGIEDKTIDLDKKIQVQLDALKR